MTTLADWTAAYPKRPGAPLILEGATLAEALRTTARPQPPVLQPSTAALLPLLATNATAQQIGRRLGISTHAVNARLSRLYAALEVHNRVGAVTAAMACGLLPEPGSTP